MRLRTIDESAGLAGFGQAVLLEVCEAEAGEGNQVSDLWQRVHDTFTEVAAMETQTQYPCKSVMCPLPADKPGGYCSDCQKERDKDRRQQEELERIRREQGS